MSGRAAFTLLLASWAALPWPLGDRLPAWAERLLYNPRERTAEAIAAAERGSPREAVAPAETALRLAPDDPLVQYDAGTAYLEAGGIFDRRRAVETLERAARGAGPELAAAAHYNLGNARLAAGDPAGAVEAFKQTLRLEPGNADAKFNLELALKARQRPRLPFPPSPSGGSGGTRSRSSERSAEGPEKGESRAGGGEETDQPAGQAPSSRFRDQPGMSAAQAAALLRAVENLERQQRRAQAARQVRQRAAEDRDW